MLNMKAFSLIELMLSLAVAAILFFIAIPCFFDLIEKNRAEAKTQQLVASLQYARMAALQSGTAITFCKNGRSWCDGQKIVDQNGNVLRTLSIASSQDILIWSSSLGRSDSITFLSSGMPNGQQGSFYYCPKGSAKHALAVILEQTGRVRVSDVTASGGAIVCN